MIERIVEWALRQRFLVLLGALLILGGGIYSYTRLPVAAFPDVTPVQVQINTQAPGLAAVEVEQLISFPIESVMNGLPDVKVVRSVSKTGLSVVTVYFEDWVELYFARTLVMERLLVAKERIPEGLAEPEMGPITTGLGQVYQYQVIGEGKSLQDLRAFNDWVAKLQLRTVRGVTDVLSFGGEVRQYQIRVNPDLLLKYDLSLEDVAGTIGQNNTNAGGWYLSRGSEQLVIRGVGWVRGGREGLTDIEQIVLKHEGGIPVYIRDVAEVEYGSEIRQGAVTRDGKGEIVTGIVLQLAGANTREVIEEVRKKVDEINRTAAAEGFQVVPYYDQADLVDKAVGTVTTALIEAAVLIVVVLFLFLWNARSALVVVLSVPVSMLIAIIMMDRFGFSANLQSLGGLAIGIGMMVDGSVVMVENIFRHRAGGRTDTSYAAREVARPVFYAVLIIVVIFLPLFTLRGVEGKLFAPMAFTIAFGMLGSLIVALTIVPTLCDLVLRGRLSEKDSFLMRGMKRIYEPVVRWAVGRPAAVLVAAVALLVAALAAFPYLGTEFVPELEEGTMNIRVTMNPSISLEESMRIAARLEEKLLRHPEVTYAISRIGRAELGGDPEPISNNEIYVGLKPGTDRKKLIPVLEKDLQEIPGLLFNFGQPIGTRVDELLSGVKAQIAIRLFGDDLEVLQEKGKEIERIIRGMRGATGVQMEQIAGEAQLVVRVDREAVAQFGLNVAEVMEVISLALGGETVTEVIDEQRRFDAYVRLAPAYRSDIDTIRGLLVHSDSGALIPLSRVADVAVEEGPPLIARDNARRRVVIQCNVRGRDLGGFVREGQRLLEESGYSVEWGGQFENQQRAQATLMIVVPLSILLIFVLLYMLFSSVKPATLIILNVPFSLIGGVFALLVSGQYLSVPASIGFIAVFGVAVLNGVVLVSYLNQLSRSGLAANEAAIKGAILRLRPVLMTASVAMLGLIPLLLSTGTGSEVHRPLATVVVGGLISSTLLTLIVLPSLYRWFVAATDISEGGTS